MTKIIIFKFYDVSIFAMNFCPTGSLIGFFSLYPILHKLCTIQMFFVSFVRYMSELLLMHCNTFDFSIATRDWLSANINLYCADISILQLVRILIAVTFDNYIWNFCSQKLTGKASGIGLIQVSNEPKNKISASCNLHKSRPSLIQQE